MMGPNTTEYQSFIIIRNKVIKPINFKYSIISMIYLDLKA